MPVFVWLFCRNLPVRAVPGASPACPGHPCPGLALFCGILRLSNSLRNGQPASGTGASVWLVVVLVEFVVVLDLVCDDFG